MAIVSSGMNALPMPRPIAKQATKIVGKKAVSGPTVAEQEQPGDGGRHAGREHAKRPEPPDQPRRDALREDGDGERPGQERRAGLQRAVVADVLEVERAEEERRVHAGDEEAPDEARVDQPAQAQDAQRHDRVLDAAPRAQTNAAISAAASAPIAEDLRPTSSRGVVAWTIA